MVKVNPQMFRAAFKQATDRYLPLNDQDFDFVYIELNDFLEDLSKYNIVWKEPDENPLYHALSQLVNDYFFQTPGLREEVTYQFKACYNELVTPRDYPEANVHLLNWELSNICEKYNAMGVDDSDIAEAGHIIEEAYRG